MSAEEEGSVEKMAEVKKEKPVPQVSPQQAKLDEANAKLAGVDEEIEQAEQRKEDLLKQVAEAEAQIEELKAKREEVNKEVFDAKDAVRRSKYVFMV